MLCNHLHCFQTISITPQTALAVVSNPPSSGPWQPRRCPPSLGLPVLDVPCQMEPYMVCPSHRLLSLAQCFQGSSVAFKFKLKFEELKPSVLQLRWSHLRCSVATCGFSLPCGTYHMANVPITAKSPLGNFVPCLQRGQGRGRGGGSRAPLLGPLPPATWRLTHHPQRFSWDPATILDVLKTGENHALPRGQPPRPPVLGPVQPFSQPAYSPQRPYWPLRGPE